MKDEKLAIVFPLGFDTTHVFAKLAESGINKDTSLIFVLPEENSPRVLSSIATIDSHIATLNSRGFSLSTCYCRINEHDFTGSLKKIFDLLSKYDKIELNLSGGLRIINFLLIYLAQILGNKVNAIFTRLETDGSLIKLPRLPIRYLTNSEKDVIFCIRDFPKSQKQIATELGKSISSIQRTLSLLTEYGFVEIYSENRPSRYKASALGLILTFVD